MDHGMFLAYKCAELAGVLQGKKRQHFIEALEKKLSDNTANTDNAERIIRAAQISYPQDRRMRRKYLRKRLKEWMKSVIPRSP